MVLTPQMVSAILYSHRRLSQVLSEMYPSTTRLMVFAMPIIKQETAVVSRDSSQESTILYIDVRHVKANASAKIRDGKKYEDRVLEKRQVHHLRQGVPRFL